MDGGAAGGTPWDKSTVPVTQGIRGLDGVTLTVRRLASTADVLVQTLGFRRTREYQMEGGHAVAVFETGAGRERKSMSWSGPICRRPVRA